MDAADASVLARALVLPPPTNCPIEPNYDADLQPLLKRVPPHLLTRQWADLSQPRLVWTKAQTLVASVVTKDDIPLLLDAYSYLAPSDSQDLMIATLGKLGFDWSGHAIDRFVD